MITGLTDRAVLHFRLDYSANARRGHQLYMKDSYIEMTIPKTMSDSEAMDKLSYIFEKAFNENITPYLFPVIDETKGFYDEDLLQGFERETGKGSDEIVIRISYDNRNFRTHSYNVTEVIENDEKTDREKFFRSIGR